MPSGELVGLFIMFIMTQPGLEGKLFWHSGLHHYTFIRLCIHLCMYKKRALCVWDSWSSILAFGLLADSYFEDQHLLPLVKIKKKIRELNSAIEEVVDHCRKDVALLPTCSRCNLGGRDSQAHRTVFL